MTIFSNQLHEPFTRLLLTAICGILLIPICANAQSYTEQSSTDNTLHQDMPFRVSYSGAYRDFTIPVSANGRYIYLEAQGADGGCLYFDNMKHIGNGGRGATVMGYFKIGSGKNQIPVGSTLRTVIGGAGGSYTNHAQTNHHAAGGGGGTGVLFLPAGINTADAHPEDWVILMVAGGGGGGFAKWGGRVLDGYPGSDEEDVTGEDNLTYVANDPDYEVCVSSTGKYAGWGGRSGGGIGYQLLRDVCNSIPDSNTKPIGDSSGSDDDIDGYSGGFGGFQMSNGKMQPIGHKGGSGAANPDGGFGFGSGGGGSTNEPGGGGGYTGGRSGSTSTSSTPAGGGGSYINRTYCNASGRKYKRGITDKSIDGFVRYRITDINLFQLLPGVAKDIAAGNDGSLWKISDEPTTGGHKIYKFNGSNWELKKGGASRIAVAYSGIPWIVNDQGDIFRAKDVNASDWDKIPGKARDIAVNNGGRPWIIGTTPTGGGYSIHYYDGSNWHQVPGGAVRIGAGDVPWVVNNSNNIYRAPANENFKYWQEVSGSGSDIGVSKEGQAYVVGSDNKIWRRDGNTWTSTKVEGKSVSAGINAFTASDSGIHWITDSVLEQQFLK